VIVPTTPRTLLDSYAQLRRTPGDSAFLLGRDLQTDSVMRRTKL